MRIQKKISLFFLIFFKSTQRNNVIPKEYIFHEVTITINHKTRRALRDALIKEFLKEDGGYIKNGVKYVQAYKYYVETLKNGKRVYLQRPA